MKLTPAVISAVMSALSRRRTPAQRKGGQGRPKSCDRCPSGKYTRSYAAKRGHETAGGAGGDPVFTESTVGRSYLISRGLPSEVITVETEGESTVHSVALAGEILRRMGLRSVVVVSDGYHIHRVKWMLESNGLAVVRFAPERAQPRTAPAGTGNA